jgi:hypothetical protein
MHHSTHQAPPIPGTGPSLHRTTDQDLANWLDDCRTAGHHVAYVHGGYLCKIADLDEPSRTLHTADPQDKTKVSLKKLVGRGLLRHLEMSRVALVDAREADPTWTYSPVTTKGEVDVLIATRDGLLGRTSGRGADISIQTAQKVWADAGGRCMFEGCPCDLTEIPLWTGSARVGYLAHIIASDPDGPRGNQADSHRLANNPENIMLMCDAHHRLIDSFAPADFPPARLNEMRRKRREQVKLYLDALSYLPSQAVTLHANLAYVPTYFHDTEFVEAILATGRSMLPRVIHYIRRENQRDDRNTSGFWANYLREHEGHIHALITGFNAVRSSPAENISVFPLHHVPTMVLAGRIMGEAQFIQVFQYDRERRSWAWNPQSVAKPAGTFSVSYLPEERVPEALVTIELTSAIDEKAIPADLKANVDAGQMPWIRITTPNPRFNCIDHPEDLEQFMRVVRSVIIHVQDRMRVQKIHLIAISPASTVFRFGQMLQAGHHPEYIVYDRAGSEYPFVPAFSITGHNVSAPDGERPFSISLR